MFQINAPTTISNRNIAFSIIQTNIPSQTEHTSSVMCVTLAHQLADPV